MSPQKESEAYRPSQGDHCPRTLNVLKTCWKHVGTEVFLVDLSFALKGAQGFLGTGPVGIHRFGTAGMMSQFHPTVIPRSLEFDDVWRSMSITFYHHIMIISCPYRSICCMFLIVPCHLWPRWRASLALWVSWRTPRMKQRRRASRARRDTVVTILLRANTTNIKKP